MTPAHRMDHGHGKCRTAGPDDAGRLVAVIGPPAVGKSSVTGLAADALEASVLRLREFAERYWANHPELDHLFETADPLGWFRDDTVKILLDAAFNVMSRAAIVFLENMPGNAIQMRLLGGLASAAGYKLELVELTAPDSLLALRSSSRRVCLSCEPDRRGDPHRPALGSAAAPDECARCGYRLVPRRSDEPHLRQARLRRFRSEPPQIRAAAAEAGLPHRVIDATGDLTSVSALFLSACRTRSATVVRGATR